MAHDIPEHGHDIPGFHLYNLPRVRIPDENVLYAISLTASTVSFRQRSNREYRPTC